VPPKMKEVMVMLIRLTVINFTMKPFSCEYENIILYTLTIYNYL
jgi:hypothetical protein